MKRFLSVLGVLFLFIFTLSACDVHFGDNHYDIPWYFIAIPVIIFTAIVFAVAGKIIANKKYVCPKCYKTFSPKWWVAAFSLHINGERLFKCPHCGRKNFCHISKEEE